MRTYDVLTDYGLENKDADRVTLNAGCVVAVYRYQYPVTFSRNDQSAFSRDASQAVKMRAPLFIVEDVVSASVASTKTNHVSSASIKLRPGMNYLSEIMPGDFVLVWMTQFQEETKSLVTKLKNGEAANGWTDGLKFFGRASTVQKTFDILADGQKTSSYDVSAAGFVEFDGSVYFEPYLAIKSVGIMSDWLQRYGIAIDSVISQNGEGISTNKILPVLLDVFFGTGVPENARLKEINGAKVTSGMDNPFSFILPKQVGSVFGVKKGSKPHGLIAYTDLLEVVHGIQKYTSTFTVDTASSDAVRGMLFQPEGTGGYVSGKKRYTQQEQHGVFLPSPPAFTGQKTAWSIIQQFMNRTVNELYTTLRTNPEGKIFPTLICRQLPFSSGLVSSTYRPRPIEPAQPSALSSANRRPRSTKDKIAQDQKAVIPDRQLVQTYFWELPRWRIHPVFLKHFSVGRSDALRFNFIHLQPEAGAKTGLNVTGSFVRDPPVRDDLDIARSGLRPYMQTVSCSPQDTATRAAGAWMQLLSDFLMGQHLTLTGRLQCDGITAPISIGDNIEVDDTILHIEGLVHSFTSDSNGNRRFGTVLSLTHGMTADQLDNTDDLSLYTGIQADQLRRFDPAVTVSEDRQDESAPTVGGLDNV